MADTVAELLVKISADNAELKAKLNDSTKATETSFASISKSILSAGASIGIFSQLLKGIQFNAAAESAKTAFTVMLNSVSKANDMLAELKKYSNETPLEFKDIRDAAQTLLQFGIEGEKVNDTIRMLGDVSGGNADKLKSLSLVFWSSLRELLDYSQKQHLILNWYRYKYRQKPLVENFLKF